MLLKIKTPQQMTTRRPTVYIKHYLPLVEQSVMMIYSGGGVGKSFASIRVAVEFAEETGKRVALWLTEDPEGENRDRYERIINERKKPREFYDAKISFISSEPVKFTKLHDGNAVLTDEYWESRIDLIDYGLVVIDPLLQFQGCDENSNTHAGVMMGAFKEWAAEEEKIILVLHHATAYKDGAVKPRGAGEWTNGTRGCYHIKKQLNSDNSDDYSARNKRIFKLTKENGLGYYFRNETTGEMERLLDVFPDKKEVEYESTRPGMVRMSFADHNDARNPKGFESQTVEFSTLHELVTKNRCYSPYSFANGHRKNENNLGFSDVLCLDFDDGMNITEALAKFAKCHALIITTRSHTLEKNRFRVIIRLKTPLAIQAEDHRDFMTTLFDLVGSVDPATKDMARFFFASPEGAEYWYTHGEPFDWHLVYRQMIKKRTIEKLTGKIKGKEKFDRGTIQGPQSNTLPRSETFTTHRGQALSFGNLRETMSHGEKVKVQCRHGYGHNGGRGPDRNAAAFICKADNGNVFYHCSGGKCAGEGVIWCED